MPPKISQDLKPKYFAGEKILCFHGPLLYEAKCHEVKFEGNNVKYFVHYQGWNKNWDEWVFDTRMKKFNEAGLKKQKELEKVFKSGKKLKALRKSDLQNQVYPPSEALDQLKELEKKEIISDTPTPAPATTMVSDSSRTPSEAGAVKWEGRPPSTPTSEPPSSAPSSTVGSSQIKSSSTTVKIESSSTTVLPKKRFKRGTVTDGTVEGDEGLLKKLQLKIDFPDQIRLWIVDDWDLITRQSRLVQLPARLTIDEVMQQYIDWSPQDLRKHPEPLADLKAELTGGLVGYFNLVLGSQLLYKFERVQYAEILRQHPSKKLSQIYGPVHLLRLLVNLREMVSYTKVDVKSLPSLEYLLRDFLDFLDQNSSDFIQIEDFIVATAEYQRRAMC